MTFGSQTTAQVSPQEKLNRIAAELAKHQLDGYYLPPEDEHLNEYLPETKKRIEWLTGFSGENAPLLVTPQKMHLYVDGRFHLQVDDEVDATVVDANKLPADRGANEGIMDDLKGLVGNNGQKPLRIGYDPFIVSPRRLKALEKSMPKSVNVQWVSVAGNLVDTTWTQRPALPAIKAFAVDESLTGRSVEDKLSGIRAELKEAGADVLPVTKLDDVCWLYNVRGGDIPYNPVLESYGLLTQDKAYLFAPTDKVPMDLKTVLQGKGITVLPYEAYQTTLTDILMGHSGGKPKVLVDMDSLTLGTLDIVKAHADVVEKDNPITMQKAIKNDKEIEKMLLANFRASRAIIRHMAAMEQAFNSGTTLSEVVVRADLEAKYKEEPEFFDLSFPTIPGIGSNSAIIHYSKADPNKIAANGDFYLLDSGCQYLGGTTDTTRTTVLGKPDQSKVDRYTAVLKSHIACANYHFQEGTSGMKIDAVCREPMWQEGLDFAHGTGHGVGAFLNVHEGPNRISKVCSVVFKPGMVTSIEPGFYEKDWGGIRLENLYYVVEDKSTPDFQGRKWLKFVPLTYAPFEKKLTDFSKLTARETAWLKQYYQQIMDKVYPTLNDANEQAWLKDQCTIP